MEAVLVFGIALLLAVLISRLADRSIISTAVLFLGLGILLGTEWFEFVHLEAGTNTVERLSEFALVAVLFTDGQKLGWRELREAWGLPGRALFLGLPLTLAFLAVLAHLLVGLDWVSALLVGAVLSPTDPVFASSIVGKRGVSRSLRHLLNVESGFNDGLALPVVLGILSFGGATTGRVAAHLVELGAGLVIGVLVPLLGMCLERSRWFGASRSHEALLPFSIGLIVFATAELSGANAFVAAFAAGITVATLRDSPVVPFEFGEQVAELLKLAALLVFGLLVSRESWAQMSIGAYGFAVLALVLARPVALSLALVNSSLSWPDRVAAMWFGPKGFASVVYGLIVLHSGFPDADAVFHLVAMVVALSIVAHSSTDVAVAGWLQQRGGRTA